MEISKTQPTMALTMALAAALILTFGIVLIKAGALPWVSLSWVSIGGISLTILLYLNTNTDIYRLINRVKNNFYGSLFVIVFIIFQLWTWVQYFTFSSDQAASLNQSLIGIGMVFLLCIWFIAMGHPKAFYFLLTSALVCGVIQTIYGFWVYLTDTNMLLWMPKEFYLDRITGFFVNANHFAAYIVLCIILCVSRDFTAIKQSTNKHSLFSILDQLYNPYKIVLMLLLIALIASKSIGAMVSLLVIILLLGIKLFFSSNNKLFLLLVGFVVLAISLLSVLSLDYTILENQFANLSHTVNRRIELSKAAFDMLQSNWLWGVGGGAFYSEFSSFRTLEIGNSYYNYAHNDLLQFWIEYGLVGILLLVAFITLAIKNNIETLSESRRGIRAAFAFASIYTTIALGVHSLVDFPLHIPGYSVFYLVLISANSLHSINHRVAVYAKT